MNYAMAVCLVIAGLLLTACSNTPTREEFLAREAVCLRCYCASNAPHAEAALLDCYRYTQRCRQAGIQGIQYDEVLARMSGRLFLVEQHLGNYETAQQYLESYAQFAAARRNPGRPAGWARSEIAGYIERDCDRGLQAAWKGR